MCYLQKVRSLQAKFSASEGLTPFTLNRFFSIPYVFRSAKVCNCKKAKKSN